MESWIFPTLVVVSFCYMARGCVGGWAFAGLAGYLVWLLWLDVTWVRSRRVRPVAKIDDIDFEM